MKRTFVCYYHFIRWSCISFGFHIDISQPNIEIHLPFGFLRIGWKKMDEVVKEIYGKAKWKWSTTQYGRVLLRHE